MNLAARIALGALATILLVAFLVTSLDSAHAKVLAAVVVFLVVGTLAAIATYRRLSR